MILLLLLAAAAIWVLFQAQASALSMSQRDFQATTFNSVVLSWVGFAAWETFGNV